MSDEYVWLRPDRGTGALFDDVADGRYSYY